MVFKILTLPFILNKWTSLIKYMNWNWRFFAKFFFLEMDLELFSLIFFAELELELLGSIFSAQSWSRSLKALGVNLETAPNRSRLSISARQDLKWEDPGAHFLQPPETSEEGARQTKEKGKELYMMDIRAPRSTWPPAPWLRQGWPSGSRIGCWTSQGTCWGGE